MMMPAAKWAEDTLARGVGNLFTLEELAHSGIIAHAHDITRDLDLEVKVADHPTKACSVGGFPCGESGALDLDHRLVFLRNEIGGGFVLKNDRAIGERRLEVEAEFATILGDSAPAPFREGESLSRDAERGQSGVRIGQRAVNDLHL
jgi:hypothetical protein